MIASGINIGRRRGEFERATATMRSIEGGHRDPRAAGVCEIARLADLYRRGAALFCAQAKAGRLAQGVPDELWARACRPDEAHPAGFTGRALQPETMHVFMPEQADATIRGGHVFIKRAGRTLAWTEPELFAHLGQGYRLTVRFDPTEPSLGAAVFNREIGSRNRDGFGAGQLLAIAEWAPECPQICAGIALLTPEEERTLTHKKRFDHTVRAEYRAIGIWGRRAARSSERRGNRLDLARAAEGMTEAPAAVAEPVVAESRPETRAESRPAMAAARAAGARVGGARGAAARDWRTPRGMDADQVRQVMEETDALEARLRESGALMPA